jgi:hypothetical protein
MADLSVHFSEGNPRLEFDCRSRLTWKRDGADWVMWCGRRRMGRVVPDNHHPGMYRSVKSGGRLSDMANLSWSKDAVLAAAMRALEWEVCHKAARTPSKCPEKGGSFKDISSGIRANDLAASGVPGRAAA